MIMSFAFSLTKIAIRHSKKKPIFNKNKRINPTSVNFFGLFNNNQKTTTFHFLTPTIEPKIQRPKDSLIVLHVSPFPSFFSVLFLLNSASVQLDVPKFWSVPPPVKSFSCLKCCHSFTGRQKYIANR